MPDYEIVVATRNRRDVLSAALPLFLAQDAPPRAVTIVDASDDHAAIVALGREAGAGATAPVRVVEARRRSLPAQRNQGLEVVEAPIVLFPDDDSLWYPDTARGFLAAYEHDRDGALGGVNAHEAAASPLADPAAAPRKSREHDLKRAIEPYRRAFEDRFFPHPFNVYGREAMRAHPGRAALDESVIDLNETLSGFRMSFRTEAIRKVGFDETLGYGVGYATHEDKEASLGLLDAGYLIAGAPRARVYHNTHPSKRTGGFVYGFCHIFNYIYILKKYAPEDSRVWTVFERYFRYKLTLYGLRRADPYNRAVHEGARVAFAARDRLLRPEGGDLAEAYRRGFDALARDPVAAAA